MKGLHLTEKNKIKLHEKFSTNYSVRINSIKKREFPENSEQVSPVAKVLTSNPAESIYQADGVTPFRPPNISPEVRNPLAIILTHEQDWKQYKTFNFVEFEYKPIKGFVLTGKGNLDFSEATERIFEPEYYYDNNDYRQINKFTVSKHRWRTWNIEGYASYERTIADAHTVKGLFGGLVNDYKYSFLTGSNENLITKTLEEANLGVAEGTIEKQTANESFDDAGLLSLYGRISYNFKDKYTFTSNFRRDGSSKFGKDKRFGFFSSASASWVLSEESFFKNLSIESYLDYVKLRVSWGKNGNSEIGSYGYLPSIVQEKNYTFGDNSNENLLSGSSLGKISNSELHWETSSQTDIGVDFGLLQGKLDIAFDYYNKKTEGVLSEVPIPIHVGFSPPSQNTGNVSNSGFEFDVTHNNTIGEWSYSFGVNFSINQNNVESLGNDDAAFVDGQIQGAKGSVLRTQKDYPIASFFGYKTAGIFQNKFEVEEYVNTDGDELQPNAIAGDFIYRDVNNDGKIDENDYEFLGSPIPKNNFGINASVNYKNFDFNISLQGATGHYIYRAYTVHAWGQINVPRIEIENRWTGEGTTRSHPAIRTPASTELFTAESQKNSDWYLEKADYVKVRNIQLGYTLPEKLLKRVRIKRARVFFATLNPFTFTSYSGYDPEIGLTNDSGNGGGRNYGIDRGFYPLARTYNMGIQIDL